MEPGDTGSANLNGSFQGPPRSSKVLQGCPRLFIVCIAPRFSEQFIFLRGLGAFREVSDAELYLRQTLILNFVLECVVIP